MAGSSNRSVKIPSSHLAPPAASRWQYAPRDWLPGACTTRSRSDRNCAALSGRMTSAALRPTNWAGEYPMIECTSSTTTPWGFSKRIAPGFHAVLANNPGAILLLNAPVLRRLPGDSAKGLLPGCWPGLHGIGGRHSIAAPHIVPSGWPAHPLGQSPRGAIGFRRPIPPRATEERVQPCYLLVT